MKCSNIPTAQLAIASCIARQIKHIVISPGSRNAPLTIGFTENPFFECYPIVDERPAAFFALGLSMQQKEPVVLVCTSGSALLNYYPAIAEAFYSNIPLVVLSADRPPYRIDIGDGQTIRQKNVFQNHIGLSSNLKLDVNHSTFKIEKYAPDLLDEEQEQIFDFNKREIGNALDFAIQNDQPVHLNIPFEEPLYGKEDFQDLDIDKEAIANLKIEIEFDNNQFKTKWGNAQRKMVLIGVSPPNKFERRALELLANDPTVLVLTETTSNVFHENFFPSIDSIIFPIEKSSEREKLSSALQAEILLTFGGMIVSKKIKAFLRDYKPKEHWHVGRHRFNDTYFSLTHHVNTNESSFIESLYLDYKPFATSYFSNWNKVKVAYEQKRNTYLKEVPFSDFWVFGEGIPMIPKNYQVHLANSSTVRYAQLFDMDPSFEIFCNRGTSGIEGSTSTALGASIHHRRPTLLITGDLSFFYDSNALWNNYIRNDFRILLINNSGGGIFRILPGKEDNKNFKTFFETRHHLKAKELADMYQFEYLSAQDKVTLKKGMKAFFDPGQKPKVFEVFTPPETNDRILLDYFDFIS